MTIRRGFLPGKFMPPHAGHLALIEAARRLVDELTVLVCWLAGDPIDGELRLAWMRELLPDCRIAGHGEIAPQTPEESADFWPIWRAIVKASHPEPIDLVFAGEAYGADLAREVGGLFVPLGNRILAAENDPLGSLSASAIRADPAGHWRYLPEPVRRHYRRIVCLHGAESTGKSVLAGALARHFDAPWAGEYGRSHCEVHREPLDLAGLELIADAQQATIAAAEPWAGPLLIADTDALMTAAWTEMLLGKSAPSMLARRKADLYLLLEPDVPWVADGTRYFDQPEQHRRFAAVVERVLVESGVPFVRIAGDWNRREATAKAAVEALLDAAVAEIAGPGN